MGELLLDDFRCDPIENGRILSCRVKGADLPKRLTFRMQGSNIPQDTLPLADWAVAGLVYPAMALGADLIVEAPITAHLRFALTRDIQSLFKSYRSRLQFIDLKVDTASVVKSTAVGPRTATGYSAGVDTFTTLAVYEQPTAPSSITDLAVFNVGAFGKSSTAGVTEIFASVTDRLREFASWRRCDWQTVHTNLSDFYGMPKSSFQKTHSIRNASAALALHDLYDCYLYSSSYPYVDINSRNDDMAFIEPMLMPLLSSKAMTITSAGAGFSRLEKMRIVSDYAPAFDRLDICVAPASERINRVNCSKCWKCLRALITFEALGKLENFSSSFDLDYYRTHREDAIRAVTKSAAFGKPADRDVLELLSGTEFQVRLSMKDRLGVRLARVEDWFKMRSR